MRTRGLMRCRPRDRLSQDEGSLGENPRTGPLEPRNADLVPTGCLQPSPPSILQQGTNSSLGVEFSPPPHATPATIPRRHPEMAHRVSGGHRLSYT